MAFPSHGQPADYEHELSDDSFRHGFLANANTCRVDAGRASCHAFYRGFSIAGRNYQSPVVYHCFYLSAIKKHPARQLPRFIEGAYFRSFWSSKRYHDDVVV